MIQNTNYGKRCKTTQGAIKKLYLFPYIEYSSLLIQTDGTNLIAFPITDIYTYEVLGSYNQNSQLENGAVFVNQNVSCQLPKVYELIDPNVFLQQQYSVIVETNNGDNILFGAYNGMDASITNGSGSEKAEFNGFNLDFLGDEELTGLWIEDLADFFIVNTANTLNALLNFKI